MAADPVYQNASNVSVKYNNTYVYEECEAYALNKATQYTTITSSVLYELVITIGENQTDLPIYIKYNNLFYPCTVTSGTRKTVDLASITPEEGPYMDSLKINNNNRIDIHDARIDGILTNNEIDTIWTNAMS